MECPKCFVPMKRGTAKQKTGSHLLDNSTVPELYVPVLKCPVCSDTVEVSLPTESKPASFASAYYGIR